MQSLFAPLDTLPGIGAKLSASFADALSIHTVMDVLLHVPYAYIDRRHQPASKRELTDVPIITLPLTVLSYEHRGNRFSKKPFKVLCDSPIGPITVMYFHSYTESIKKQFPLTSTRIVSGKWERYGNQIVMSHPDYVLPPSKKHMLPHIEPHYTLTAGVTQKVMRNTIKHALEIAKKTTLPEWWAATEREDQNLPGFMEALQQLHAPEALQSKALEQARKRLVLDELCANQLALAQQRQEIKREAGMVIPKASRYPAALHDALPFALTDSQASVMEDIYADLASPEKMFRLLQGDVGSGKTVVALLAMLEACEAGYQAAIMAPTEILAEQHAQWITEMLTEAGLLEELNPVLLKGSLPALEKKAMQAKIQSNSAKIVIGTHALFQQSVTFASLGLVVVDEQHRFGVKQRQLLLEKSASAEALFMSATPIPRTLMMTLFGDMDISILSGKPPGRQEIDTRVISLSRIDDVQGRLVHAILANDQVYWVCPLIEESELSELTPAEQRHKELDALYPGKVGLLHGRMSPAEKDTIMQRFVRGELMVLVATTVIEVGVNVPNACVMVIEHAERFGLSQLHQLRGRVGRGSKASSCILLYDSAISQTGRSRLEVMRNSNDGFLIAEEDLKLRGAGDMLGTKQSGLPYYKIAVLPDDSEHLRYARDAAALYLQQGLSQEHHLLLQLFGYDVQKHRA